MQVLTAEAIEELCRVYPGWSPVDGALIRTYQFKTFTDSIEFVNRVASLAEASGHHPDIDIRYDTVRLALTTHDAGGMSARDAAFITSISKW